MLCEQMEEIEVLKAYNSSRLLLSEAPRLSFDFCILDIEMPEINGLQAASLLKGKPVIFATAYKEYAADAFDLDAVDYIRKPIKPERLRQAVQKVILHFAENIRGQEKNFFQINTDKGKTVIFFERLCYISVSENDSRDKIAKLSDGEELVLKNITFEKLSEILPVRQFCRVNKREIIALNAVRFFSHDEITTSVLLPSGKPLVLTLGDAYRNDFLQRLKI
jgi:DNA-binding LytR/AlgR family response regulator